MFRPPPVWGMPSTLVHLALGALVGAALLDRLTPRRLAVVLAATAVPDLDTFVGLLVAGGHRAALHTVLVPLAAGALLGYDLRRKRSWLRGRFGPGAGRVAGVALAALLLGGVGPDLFSNGVNVLYPVHDQFYRIDGELLLSNREGIVQTFVDLSPPEPSEPSGPSEPRTTENFRFRTVLDAEPTLGVEDSGGGGSGEPQRVERLFPVAMTGFRAWLLPLSAFVTAVRLRRA
jgi:hypothetical protein